MRAGIKQVKNRLSYFLRRVREGELIEVTDRGEVVAELRPPRRAKKHLTDREALKRLADEGIVVLPTREGRIPDFEPAAKAKPFDVVQMIFEDRR